MNFSIILNVWIRRRGLCETVCANTKCSPHDKIKLLTIIVIWTVQRIEIQACRMKLTEVFRGTFQAHEVFDIDIFVNCSWVDIRWQWYSTHLHTNNT
jgi:hypothetical protein